MQSYWSEHNVVSAEVTVEDNFESKVPLAAKNMHSTDETKRRKSIKQAQR